MAAKKKLELLATFNEKVSDISQGSAATHLAVMEIDRVKVLRLYVPLNTE